MKSQAFAQVDAHIICCRLHHHNSYLYSIALKPAKSPLLQTQFYPSHNMLIPIDLHLTLPVDKYAYEEFPKLTLIVNAMRQNEEKKTVGTTFVNFRKEGLQTIQVSECSCKDKAFEVDISFTSKVVDPKSSIPRSPKNQTKPQLKLNYLSYQVTPRDSRLLQADATSKGLQQQPERDSKPYALKTIKSKQKAKTLVETHKKLEVNKKRANGAIKQAAVLTQQKMQYGKITTELSLSQKQLHQQRHRNQILEQLLQIEYQKNKEANYYIQVLEEGLKEVFNATNPKQTIASITSFKVIEQRDEIILMNEELQTQLQRQQQRANFLSAQVEKLTENLSIALNKLSQAEMQPKNREVIAQQGLQIKSRVQNFETAKILLSSRNDQMQQHEPENKTPKEDKEISMAQIDHFQTKIKQLKQEISKLQAQKLNLEKQIIKLRDQTKKNTEKRSKVIKKQENLRKIDKISKQIPIKSPPLKQNKKNSSIVPPQLTQIPPLRKSEQLSKRSISSADKNTKISTQVESKVEQDQSLGKAQDRVFNQAKSELKAETNELAYYVNTFQDEIPNF